jgi:hypothetical protein
MYSLSDFTGMEGCTTKTMGRMDISEIGARSLMGSKLRFG